jgi:hypothetical protein
MNLRNIIVAGAVLALASPVAALAQGSTLTPSQAQAQAYSNLTTYDRSQVVNILGLLQGGQIDRATAAVQIDGVLSDSESKAIAALANQVPSLANDASDAGQFLVDLAQPPSK